MKNLVTILSLILTLNTYSQKFEIVDIEIPDDYYGSTEFYDFDNDSDLDILFTGSNGTSGNENMETIILINNGDDNFNKLQINIPGTEQGVIRGLDYNNDTLTDIFVMGLNPPNTFSKLYKNTGDTLIEIFEFNPGLRSGDAKWSDLNNDLLPDLVMLGLNSSYQELTKIFKNYGDDTFSEVSASIVNTYGASIDIADFNNDSLNDILIVGGSPDTYTKLYKNNSNFQFEEVLTNINGVQGSGIFYDFNLDKHYDILLGGFTFFPDMTTLFYINKGDTLFESTKFDFMELSYPAFSIGDFNNDTLPDIIICGRDQSTSEEHIIIYYNKTDTIQQDTLNVFSGLYNGEISTGDYDNDGDIDFIVTGIGNGPKTRLYKNIGLPITSIPENKLSCRSPINIYPNPASDKISIEFELMEDAYIIIDLIDLQGRLIKEYISDFYRKGIFYTDLSVEETKGIYILNVKIDSMSYSKRILIE